MQRRHRMPFGAEPCEDGKRIRFRLWAAAARSVDLCLIRPEREVVLPMQAEGDGWFGLESDLAAAGTRYRYRIDGAIKVPDPASRYQPFDVHGPSEVVDGSGFEWRDDGWRGRPWEEAVFYELHVGTFTRLGSFEGVKYRLAYLAELGITAIELMPVADFPGSRNWGYDGVYPFAPESSYGRPEELKDLIQTAHANGLMVFLDVVYNHFGPEGNYLNHYAPHFFTGRHHTPWGEAINFDGAHSHWVREFVIHNALYWLEEYHVDGLRLDAVHAIIDESHLDILEELAERVRKHFDAERKIHLVLENDNNAAHYLKPCESYDAQWNDDLHHAFHVLTTGESAGYYRDFRHRPVHALARSLAEGFSYQGDASEYRDGRPRGEPSAHLPPTAFVSFIQNHDQIGNRAFGERLTELATPEALRAVTIILLLAPSPPLLFMGQEWASTRRFPFFCHFGPDLAKAVSEGRRREFSQFPEFADDDALARIPDPMAESTFESARLDWEHLADAQTEDWLDFHRQLLSVRQREIVPRLAGTRNHDSRYEILDKTALRVGWRLGDGARLELLGNLGPLCMTGATTPEGRPLARYPETLPDELARHRLPAWSAGWWLTEST